MALEGTKLPNLNIYQFILHLGKLRFRQGRCNAYQNTRFDRDAVEAVGNSTELARLRPQLLHRARRWPAALSSVWEHCNVMPMKVCIFRARLSPNSLQKLALDWDKKKGGQAKKGYHDGISMRKMMLDKALKNRAIIRINSANKSCIHII